MLAFEQSAEKWPCSAGGGLGGRPTAPTPFGYMPENDYVPVKAERQQLSSNTVVTSDTAHCSAVYTQLYSPSKAATIKTNKTKKKKRNKPLQDKSNTTGQHISILGLIFSTQSTNDIIGYGELAQKIRLSITYAHHLFFGVLLFC